MNTDNLKTILFLIIFSTLVACDGSAVKATPSMGSPMITFREPASDLIQRMPKYSRLAPTIYYIPRVNASESQCDRHDKIPMRNKQGKVLTVLCKDDYQNCLLQGTCIVEEEKMIEDKKVKTERYISVQGKFENEYRFYIQKIEECKNGMGSRGACLDPFYSVAADLNFHNYGDVIYVPEVDGVKLPNGETHPGYFIVRDEGGAIKGRNRFDFFTGNITPDDSDNIFSKIGLADKTSKMHFIKVDKKRADAVRKIRNFPLVPQ